MNINDLRQVNEFLRLIENPTEKRKFLDEAIAAKEAALAASRESDAKVREAHFYDHANASVSAQIEQRRLEIEKQSEELQAKKLDLENQEKNLRSREVDLLGRKNALQDKEVEHDRNVRQREMFLTAKEAQLKEAQNKAEAVKAEFELKLKKLKETIGG
jgi:hypothetical protein